MYCYGSGAGYGRFIDRVEQPLFVPGQKGTDKSGTRKATSCRHVRCVETGEVFEKVSDNPAAKEHGSLAAARLPKEAQCGCAKCAMAREQFEKVRALSLKMVRKSNRGA